MIFYDYPDLYDFKPLYFLGYSPTNHKNQTNQSSDIFFHSPSTILISYSHTTPIVSTLIFYDYPDSYDSKSIHFLEHPPKNHLITKITVQTFSFTPPPQSLSPPHSTHTTHKPSHLSPYLSYQFLFLIIVPLFSWFQILPSNPFHLF